MKALPPLLWRVFRATDRRRGPEHAAPSDLAASLRALLNDDRGSPLLGDDEETFPDPMAQQMGALWNESHKEFGRAFASF